MLIYVYQPPEAPDQPPTSSPGASAIPTDQDIDDAINALATFAPRPSTAVRYTGPQIVLDAIVHLEARGIPPTLTAVIAAIPGGVDDKKTRALVRLHLSRLTHRGQITRHQAETTYRPIT